MKKNMKKPWWEGASLETNEKMNQDDEKRCQSLQCCEHRQGRAPYARRRTHIGTLFYVQSVHPIHQQVRGNLITDVHDTDGRDNWQVHIPADQSHFSVDVARALVRSVTQRFNHSLGRETVSRNITQLNRDQTSCRLYQRHQVHPQVLQGIRVIHIHIGKKSMGNTSPIC